MFKRTLRALLAATSTPRCKLNFARGFDEDGEGCKQSGEYSKTHECQERPSQAADVVG